MSFAVLVFEAVVLVVLAGAGIMCWRVDRRLRALRDGQDGLRETVVALDEAVERARASLAALDRASKGAGADLQDSVREARALADELRLLTEAGDQRAERLSGPRRRAEPAASSRPAPRSGGRPLDTVR
jgi:hypothetical protein